MIRTAIALVAVLGAGITIAACSDNSDVAGTPLDQPTGDNSSADDGGGCDPGPVQQGEDPSKFPTCCSEGAAHCVPTDKLSPSEQAAAPNVLSSCTGGYCVPDKFIKDPSHVPTPCKAFNGTDGVCMSVCVPQVHQYESVLKQDVCDSDERCAPCINPLTKESSGACDINKKPKCGDDGGGGPPPPSDAGPVCPYSGPPLIDVSKLPVCDPNGGAHCVDASLVPQAQQSQLAPCPGGKSFCVPDAFSTTGGNFIPPTCSSLVGAEGRCLHEAIPKVAAQASQLPQSTCAKYEKCVPCYSPMDGTDTGACKQSCDPGPKNPPKLFQQCCSQQGKCIPTSEISADQQKSLGADSCTDQSTLCVPTEMLPPNKFTPQQCTGQGFISGQYSGVCLSKCLKFSFIQQLGIDHGDCSDPNHDCVPCQNPLTQQPTGAPGCP